MKRKNISSLYGYILLFILFIAVTYFAIQYKKNVETEGGYLFFCDKGKCFATEHVHADIYVSVCGKEISFEREEGGLLEQHTHKEKNLIHWHSPLPADPKTQRIIDYTQRTVGSFFTEMKMPFNETCIQDKCNGDFCNEKNASLSMHVNGKENHQYDRYIWFDKDKIEIRFE